MYQALMMQLTKDKIDDARKQAEVHRLVIQSKTTCQTGATGARRQDRHRSVSRRLRSKYVAAKQVIVPRIPLLGKA